MQFEEWLPKIDTEYRFIPLIYKEDTKLKQYKKNLRFSAFIMVKFVLYHVSDCKDWKY
jgi:hypothetical protein